MTDTLYTESPIPGGWRAGLGVVVLGAAVTVLGVSLGQAAVGIVGLSVLVISVLSMSSVRYSKITLDRSTLRVGRDQMPLSAIDPVYGLRRGEAELDDATRSSLEIAFSSKRPGLQIFGGAYGRPMNGSKWLVIQDRQGNRSIIATRHRDRLTEALSAAMGSLEQ